MPHFLKAPKQEKPLFFTFFYSHTCLIASLENHNAIIPMACLPHFAFCKPLCHKLTWLLWCFHVPFEQPSLGSWQLQLKSKDLINSRDHKTLVARRSTIDSKVKLGVATTFSAYGGKSNESFSVFTCIRLLLYVRNHLHICVTFAFCRWYFPKLVPDPTISPIAEIWAWKQYINKTVGCWFTLIKGCLCMCQVWICTWICVNVLIFAELGMCASVSPLAFHCTFIGWYNIIF